MSHSVPSHVSGRRSEDRNGRQDSSAAEGPFSPAGLKVSPLGRVSASVFIHICPCLRRLN